MSSQNTAEESVYAEYTDVTLLAAKKNVILTIEAKDRIETRVERTKIESVAQSISLNQTAEKSDAYYKDSNMRALNGNINFGVYGGSNNQEAGLQNEVLGASEGPKSAIVSLEGTTKSELDSLSLDRLVDLYAQYRDAHPENPLFTISPEMVRKMGEFGARNFLSSLLPTNMQST